MTNVTDSDICKINETFIGKFLRLPLWYIIDYRQHYDEYVMKDNDDASR